jgi:hypothetical protein
VRNGVVGGDWLWQATEVAKHVEENVLSVQSVPRSGLCDDCGFFIHNYQTNPLYLRALNYAYIEHCLHINGQIFKAQYFQTHFVNDCGSSISHRHIL